MKASRPDCLEIDLEAAPRCSGCNGACSWYRLSANETLSLAGRAPLAVGTVVSITLPERFLLLGAALLYGVPLTALLAGAAVGAVLFGSDLAAAGMALVAVSAAWLVAPLLRRRLDHATLRELTVRPLAPKQQP